MTAPWDLAPAESLTADRELEEETGNALCQPADQIGAADRGQLTVGVDFVAVLLGESADGRDEVGEGDE